MLQLRNHAFCSKELGDIVYVEVETLDQTLEKDEVLVQ
jgi:glycine cleavage system H protein